MKHSVSVVIPNRNYARFLAPCIQSVLNQSRTPEEIIVVDDGSTDGSLSVLAELQHLYPGRIRTVTHPGGNRCGLEASFRLGMAQASGDLIAFLEADDRWYENNLYRKVGVFERMPEADVVYSDFTAFGEWKPALYWRIYSWANRLSTPKETAFDFFETFLKRNPVASFTHFVVRRGAVQNLPPLRGLSGNFDWWMLAHLSLRSKFYYIPEKLTLWRIHSDSAGFGRLSRRLLWKLHLYLEKLYASLSSKEDLTVSKRKILKGYAAFQKLIRERRKWLIFTRLLRHPFESLRFAAYVILRQMMFSGSRSRTL